MPDPSDPRLAALNNIQASSRSYGRNRRRGLDANEDPAFRAAVEIADPEQRRAALAEYARSRAAGLFPQDGAAAPPSGADVVRQAFPQGDAFAGVGTPAPRQADVVPGTPDPNYPDVNFDARMYRALREEGGPGDLEQWQAAPYAGATEDDATSQRGRQNLGKSILAGRYADRVDANVADEMLAPGSLATPEDVREWQTIPMVGAEDSPEQRMARQTAMKRILAPRGSERIEEMNERADERAIEGRDKNDPLYRGGAPNATNTIQARRRR